MKKSSSANLRTVYPQLPLGTVSVSPPDALESRQVFPAVTLMVSSPPSVPVPPSAGCRHSIPVKSPLGRQRPWLQTSSALHSLPPGQLRTQTLERVELREVQAIPVGQFGHWPEAHPVVLH